MGVTSRSLGCIAVLVATAAQAQPPMTCEGGNPDWTLSVTADSAQFSFSEAKSFDIPQRTQANERDWPKALTLITEHETAIVILNEAQCSNETVTDYPIEAFILTQRAQTPVILRGCCTVAE